MYWDGAALLAHVDGLCDPSLNWLDLPAMAPAGAAHLWMAPPPPDADRPLRGAIASYGRALRALGVDCRPAPLPGAATECLRCGHGWDEHSRASELALALAVFEDGVADLWDVAFVFAEPRVVAAVASPLGRLFPDKRLGRLTLGPARPRRPGALASPSLHLEALRLPPVVAAGDGALIAQPACWGAVPSPRRLRPSLSQRPALGQPA